MQEILEIVHVLNNFSSVGLAALVVIAVIFIARNPQVLTLLKKKVDHTKTIAGLTFEERIAYLENKQLTLENNHIAHVQKDIEKLSKDLSDLEKRVEESFTRIRESIVNIRERLARLEP